MSFVTLVLNSLSDKSIDFNFLFRLLGLQLHLDYYLHLYVPSVTSRLVLHYN